MTNTRLPTIKSPEEIQAMRVAGRGCAELLDYLTPFIRAGSSTESIDQAASGYIAGRGWIAAPLNYAPPGHKPFPKSLCFSVNHQVCHGIPGAKILAHGDLAKIDCTVIVDGWHGDSCRSFVCSPKPGSASIASTRLSKLTFEAMWEGIAAARPGEKLFRVGDAIEKFAKSHGLSTVKSFTGHGIGRGFHEAPSVKHYYDPADDLILLPGMCITVEPMLCAGKSDVKILPDGWTVVTTNRSLCAQWEHTIAIGENGPEVLTFSHLAPPPPARFSGIELNSI